jgi:hypothetical protein
MIKSQQICILQGAGLSFPVACLLYVISGQWLSFALVVFGAAAGIAAGYLGKRIQGSKGAPGIRILKRCENVETPAWLAKIAMFLVHPRTSLRFASLLGVGTFFFVLAWYVGYFLLPEGIFHAGAEAHMVRGSLHTASANVHQEWLKLFRANLLPVLFIILGSLVIKINGIPFGYLVALYNLTFYGLFVGTNSFAIPYAHRMAPTFEILRRSGPYEMAALLLLAAATGSWPLFQIKRIFRTNPERVVPAPCITWKEAVGLGLGIALLMGANWIEASMVMHL